MRSTQITSPIVDANWLKSNIGNPNLVILDSSPASNKSGLVTEYQGQQIPKARFFDLKKQFSDQNSNLPNTIPTPEAFQVACQDLGICQNSVIVVYDNLGIYTSPRVWWLFQAMGHQQVAVLDGGLPAWVNNGFETVATEKEGSNWAKGDFVAKVNIALKKDMVDVVKNLDSQEALVLDARSAGRFCGTAPEPRAGLSSGHIPHSKSLPFKTVLQDGKFKSKAELEVVFEDLSIGNQPLIFSCGSGLTACITLLAAELVTDKPKAIYDGSWTEWAQKQTHLIEKTNEGDRAIECCVD